MANREHNTPAPQGATRRAAIRGFGGLSAALGFAGVARAADGPRPSRDQVTDEWAAMLAMMSAHPNGRATVRHAIAANMNPHALLCVMWRDSLEPNRPDWPVMLFSTRNASGDLETFSFGPQGRR